MLKKKKKKKKYTHVHILFKKFDTFLFLQHLHKHVKHG